MVRISPTPCLEIVWKLLRNKRAATRTRTVYFISNCLWQKSNTGSSYTGALVGRAQGETVSKLRRDELHKSQNFQMVRKVGDSCNSSFRIEVFEKAAQCSFCRKKNYHFDFSMVNHSAMKSRL